jgi:hypothetical protein
MAARLSALRVGRPLSPGRFLVLISVRGLVDPMAIVRLEGLDHDLIENRTRDLPACSIVPQPITPPSAVPLHKRPYSLPWSFTLGERAPGTHGIGGWLVI